MRDMSQVAGPPGLQDASIPTDCQEHLLLLCTSSSNKGEQHGTATGWQSNSVIGYWLVILALRSFIHAYNIIYYIYIYIYLLIGTFLYLKVGDWLNHASREHHPTQPVLHCATLRRRVFLWQLWSSSNWDGLSMACGWDLEGPSDRSQPSSVCIQVASNWNILKLYLDMNQCLPMITVFELWSCSKEEMLR